MTLLDRQTEFTGYLVAGFSELGLRGWDLAGACAVTGNATQESLCKPVTVGTKDHGSDGGLQWRDSSSTARRLTGDPTLDPKIRWGMKPWCTQHFGDWRTLRAQAAFTLYETARDYPALDVELRTGLEGVKPGDVRRVLDYKTKKFQDDFERPSAMYANLANRQRHAASVYVVMSGKPPTKPVAPPIVTGSVGTAAGGAAVGSAAVVVNTGAVDITALVLFGLALLLAILTVFLAIWKKSHLVVDDENDPRDPRERLAAALEGKVAADAEVAEAVDALRDDIQVRSDLVSQVHSPAAKIVATLEEPTSKLTQKE